MRQEQGKKDHVLYAVAQKLAVTAFQRFAHGAVEFEHLGRIYQEVLHHFTGQGFFQYGAGLHR